MKKFISIYQSISNTLTNLDFVILLALRLVLAFGFYEPFKNKFLDIEGIATWFESLGLPAPLLQAYLATYTELAGVILLTLGFATRFITIPLLITMFVAIKTVHWENGFSASGNGFEIPFYYSLMLLCLLTKGAGKASIDYWLKEKMFKI